jgi:hypothetical protein
MVTQAERDKTIKIAKTMYRQIIAQAQAEAIDQVVEEAMQDIRSLSRESQRELFQIWDRMDAMRETPEEQAAMKSLLAEVKSNGGKQ